VTKSTPLCNWTAAVSRARDQPQKATRCRAGRGVFTSRLPSNIPLVFDIAAVRSPTRLHFWRLAKNSGSPPDSGLSCACYFPQSYLRGTTSLESKSQKVANFGTWRNNPRALSPDAAPRFPCIRRPAIRDRESAYSSRFDCQRACMGIWLSCG
jgi:hypothetical protein